MSVSGKINEIECCVICGKSHNLKNCDLIKIFKHVLDNEIPSKAKLTLPTFFDLHKLSDGSHSVTTKIKVDKGTKFGPLQADKAPTLDPTVIFSLKIFSAVESNGNDYYLNINNEEKCNWLMFVQCADFVEEQNLICYQEDAHIYYVTVKEIQTGEALKVWYAPYYATKMNKPLLGPKSKLNAALKNIDINTLIKDQQNIMERKIWTCKFCSQIENSIVSFAQHILKHYNSQRSTKCQLCEKTFRSKKNLKGHLKIVHNMYFPSTPLNNKPPKTLEPSLNSSICGDVALGGPLLNDMFNDSTDLQQHEDFDLTIANQNLLLDNDDLIVDNLLTENVKDLDHFNFDIDDNHNQFVCDICFKQFTKVKLLILHLRYHTGDFTCYNCLKIFCRKESLKSHHCNSNFPLTCMLCDKKFQQRKYLSRHLEAVHKKKFSCASCGKNYQSNRDLQEHNCSQMSNSDKEKFICPFCDKIFYRRAYLRKHLNVHKSKRMIESKGSILCEICGQRLENNDSYYKHRSKHEKPTFGCEICGRKFWRADTLKEHCLTHGESAQVECNVCKKTFKNEKRLKDHARKHDNVKPYKCSDCSSAFKYSSSLHRHLKDDHGKEKTKKKVTNEYYVCPVCDKTIKLRSSLLRHLKRVHLGVQLDLSTVRPKLSMNRSNDNSNDKLETKEQKEWDDQMDNLLDNAENSSIEKQAVDNLVEELEKNGKQEEKESTGEMNLSISNLVEPYQEITLDKNAYILDNGTIVQPQGDSNMIIYVLEQPFQV